MLPRWIGAVALLVVRLNSDCSNPAQDQHSHCEPGQASGFVPPLRLYVLKGT